MNLESIWNAAIVAYALAAVAAAGLAWSIARRTTWGRETAWLLATLGALSLQYAAAAADAFLHAGPSTTQFTFWGGATQVLLALMWMFVCLFFQTVIQRLLGPVSADGFSTWGMRIIVGSMSATAMVLFGVAAYHRIAGAPAAAVGHDLTRLMRAFSSGAAFWWIIPPTWLLQTLYQRLPKQDRHGWVAWVGQGPRDNLISLDLAGFTSVESALTVPRTAFRSLAGVYATGFLVLFAVISNSLDHWTVATLVPAAVIRLLLLPSIFWLIYYHTRFVFFDVVLKRGLLFGLLSSAAAVFAWYLFPSRPAIYFAAAALFVWLSARALEGGGRFLDRVLFRRPDYRRELQHISEQMVRCADEAALRDVLTGQLAAIMGAEFADYAAVLGTRPGLVVQIGSAGRKRGYLVLGPRARGQQYRSEDLTFIDAVAAQFAGLLESFEARRLDLLAAKAELKALRAQINPHFLFNALNTLAEMTHGEPRAEQTILNLSRIFRYALDSTQHETVALRDELDFVRAYLEVERSRFEEKLTYDIAAPEEILDAPVPPMLIQPLVENALKHGISSKLEGGAVHITAAPLDHGIRITVADDGVGFDPLRVTMNVGMTNVRSRVESLGGAWLVESKPGQGTAVSFDLVTR